MDAVESDPSLRHGTFALGASSGHASSSRLDALPAKTARLHSLR